VSLRVDYAERAINQAAEFPDGPQDIRTILDAIDRLAGFVRGLGHAYRRGVNVGRSVALAQFWSSPQLLAGGEDTAAEPGGRPAFPGTASDRGADSRRKGPGNG
jgi:hypothetical protein